MSGQPDAWVPVGMATIDLGGLKDAEGMDPEVREVADELVEEYQSHVAHNALVRRYYEGDVAVKDYGAGASTSCDQSCYWPAKAVDSLAERVRLVGFEFEDNEGEESLDRIVRDSGLVNAYNRYVPAKYLNGCMAATVTSAGGRTLVRMHSADTFTAIPRHARGHRGRRACRGSPRAPAVGRQTAGAHDCESAPAGQRGGVPPGGAGPVGRD